MENIVHLFLWLLGFTVLVELVVALFYLVKKTRQEEAVAKAEFRRIVRSLPDDQQAAFLVQYNANRRNPTLAVLLALFLGGIGAHKFYLGQTGTGILYLVFFWTYIPTILGFIEAFTISRTVIRKNRKVAREVLALLNRNVTV